jgi:hypothetical protein
MYELLHDQRRDPATLLREAHPAERAVAEPAFAASAARVSREPIVDRRHRQIPSAAVMTQHHDVLSIRTR